MRNSLVNRTWKLGLVVVQAIDFEHPTGGRVLRYSELRVTSTATDTAM